MRACEEGALWTQFLHHHPARWRWVGTPAGRHLLSDTQLSCPARLGARLGGPSEGGRWRGKPGMYGGGGGWSCKLAPAPTLHLPRAICSPHPASGCRRAPIRHPTVLEEGDGVWPAAGTLSAWGEGPSWKATCRLAFLFLFCTVPVAVHAQLAPRAGQGVLPAPAWRPGPPAPRLGAPRRTTGGRCATTGPPACAAAAAPRTHPGSLGAQGGPPVLSLHPSGPRTPPRRRALTRRPAGSRRSQLRRRPTGRQEAAAGPAPIGW